jgi:hypothetical protein
MIIVVKEVTQNDDGTYKLVKEEINNVVQDKLTVKQVEDQITKWTKQKELVQSNIDNWTMVLNAINDL